MPFQHIVEREIVEESLVNMYYKEKDTKSNREKRKWVIKREEIEKRRQNLSDLNNVYIQCTMSEIILREQVSEGVSAKASYSKAWLLKIDHHSGKKDRRLPGQLIVEFWWKDLKDVTSVIE